MMYERGELAGDLPFAQLKEREHINAAARAADRDRDFSQLIRQGRLGLFSLFLLTVFGAEGSGQIIAAV